MSVPFGKLGFIDQCRWHMRNWNAETADPRSLQAVAGACRAWINELEMVYDTIWRLTPECFATDRFVESTMIELAVCRVYIAWAQEIAPYMIYQCDKGHTWIHRASCPECGSGRYTSIRTARPSDWIPILGSIRVRRSS